MARYVEVLVESENDGKTWNEKYQLPEGIDPKFYAEHVIKEWNTEERRRKRIKKSYYPDIRKIVKVIRIFRDDVKFCRFVKKNIHSIMASNNRIFDVMVCVNCGFKFRRFGLYDVAQRECHPEKTCKEHGIELKDKESFDRHMEKVKHMKLNLEQQL